MEQRKEYKGEKTYLQRMKEELVELLKGIVIGLILFSGILLILASFGVVSLPISIGVGLSLVFGVFLGFFALWLYDQLR